MIEKEVEQNDIRPYRNNSIMDILFCYIIVASIDFGAGFSHYILKLLVKKKKINHLIHRYLNQYGKLRMFSSYSSL